MAESGPPHPTGRILKALVVDASVDTTRQMAGIAVTYPDGGVLSLDVVSAVNANVAEALAVTRAVSLAASRDARPGFEVWTDSRTVDRALSGERIREHGDPFLTAIVADLKIILREHSFRVVERYRGDVFAAHTAARGVLKAWRCGEAGHATWTRHKLPTRLGQTASNPSKSPSGLGCRAEVQTTQKAGADE